MKFNTEFTLDDNSPMSLAFAFKGGSSKGGSTETVAQVPAPTTPVEAEEALATESDDPRNKKKLTSKAKLKVPIANTSAGAGLKA